MKTRLNIPFMFSVLIAGQLFLTGCATIIGGSRYYAHVTVKDHPNASIYYRNTNQGNGYAAFSAERREADHFSVTIKEENCENQTVTFNHRVFRGWALVGSFVTWTFTFDGVPVLPLGVIIDAAVGSYWKPDIMEKGVTKTDYKHYNYLIEYTGCKQMENLQTIPPKSKADKLRELKQLLDEGVLKQEEFDSQKKKILEEDI